MTDRKKPEDLADDSLDDAQGGLIINLSVGVKAEMPTQGLHSMDASIEEVRLDRPESLIGKRDIGTGA